MACGSLTAEFQVHPSTEIGSVTYLWLTDWMSGMGLDDVIATLKRQNADSNFSVQFCYQTAAVRVNVPDAPTLLDSAFVNDGESCTGEESIASATAAKMWVRFGVAYKSVTADIYTQGDLALQCAYHQCGQMIGTASSELLAPDTSDYYWPVTGWLPAILAQKVKMALIVTGAHSQFKTRVAYQTAATSPEVPDAWSTTFDTWRSGDQEVCTGELSPTLTAKMWVRFGVQYACGTGTNLPGNVSTSTGIRR